MVGGKDEITRTKGVHYKEQAIMRGNAMFLPSEKLKETTGRI